MRIWSRIVGTLYIIAGTIFSFLLLTLWATGAKEEIISKLNHFIQQNISGLGITGIVLVIVGVVWVVNWFDYIYRTKVISFDNPGGKIKISLRAIEDYINSMLTKQIQGIRSLKVKSSISSKGLETKIRVKLYAHLNIPEICSRIQEITKDYLQDAVGIERISNIEVFVTSIKQNGEVEEGVYDEEETG
ncbi:MAG: alkaline shock response membrane anchor protein AmaP [Candidatus Omnitrophica bacterium]|nr:alkaline shock response membrane anchor protein AmaP [Candidatus Omnitrophota bacterium]MCM8777407.1 alkaline shock response membrane anchor protein AmaP [Candidatus Omnitrophota bacterium]